MLFTDVSSQRAINAFEKAGFWISKAGGKHIGMTDGTRKIVIPRHSKIFNLRHFTRAHYLSQFPCYPIG